MIITICAFNFTPHLPAVSTLCHHFISCRCQRIRSPLLSGLAIFGTFQWIFHLIVCFQWNILGTSLFKLPSRVNCDIVVSSLIFICFRNITRRVDEHFHEFEFNTRFTFTILMRWATYVVMYGVLSNKLMIRYIDMILWMWQLSNSSPDGICILLFSVNHNGNWATCHTFWVYCHLAGNLKKIESFLNALSCHLP